MDNLEIFKIEEQLAKVDELLTNCVTCADNDVEITELLSFLQQEFNTLIDDFQAFQSHVMPLIRNNQ